jgi:hypothetical protein
MITVGKVGEQKYNETQGHYTKHCVRFTNDIDMSGMKICIDVALFKENTDGLQRLVQLIALIILHLFQPT